MKAFYVVASTSITVMRMLHAARDFPSLTIEHSQRAVVGFPIVMVCVQRYLGDPELGHLWPSITTR